MSPNHLAHSSAFQTGEFLVPDHYSRFICKGSLCRHTCCSGWRVTISMKQYYTLHGLSTSKSMRKRWTGPFGRCLMHPSIVMQRLSTTRMVDVRFCPLRGYAHSTKSMENPFYLPYADIIQEGRESNRRMKRPSPTVVNEPLSFSSKIKNRSHFGHRSSLFE